MCSNIVFYQNYNLSYCDIKNNTIYSCHLKNKDYKINGNQNI